MEEEEPLPPPPPPPPPAPEFPPIGFRNRFAVRAGLFSGVAAFFLSLVSGRMGVPAALVLWLVAAGFLAVYLYHRRTGQRLSIIHGAHLGWISGIFVFGIAAIMLSVLMVALSNPDVLSAIRQQLSSAGDQQAQVDQMLEMFRSPSAVLLDMLGMFLIFTLLPACGGALGAKLLERDSQVD